MIDERPDRLIAVARDPQRCPPPVVEDAHHNFVLARVVCYDSDEGRDDRVVIYLSPDRRELLRLAWHVQDRRRAPEVVGPRSYVYISSGFGRRRVSTLFERRHQSKPTRR